MKQWWKENKGAVLFVLGFATALGLVYGGYHFIMYIGFQLSHMS